MKKLIVNADDFGFTKSVSEGIIDGYTSGCITSTSMIVNFESARYAADLFKNNKGIGIGLHFNVTKGRPVADVEKVSSLVDKDGNFHSSRWYDDDNNKIDVDELILELNAQHDLFVELIGQQPDHFNIHHIYDFYSNYPKFYEYVTNKYHVPIRMDKYPCDYDRKIAYKVDTLKYKEVTAEVIYSEMKKMLDKDILELAMHPGYSSEELEKLSSLTLEREKELELLKQDSFKENVNDLGYQLCSFKEI